MPTYGGRHVKNSDSDWWERWEFNALVIWRFDGAKLFQKEKGGEFEFGELGISGDVWGKD
jgi:hypothetical protein